MEPSGSRLTLVLKGLNCTKEPQELSSKVASRMAALSVASSRVSSARSRTSLKAPTQATLQAAGKHTGQMPELPVCQKRRQDAAMSLPASTRGSVVVITHTGTPAAEQKITITNSKQGVVLRMRVIARSAGACSASRCRSPCPGLKVAHGHYGSVAILGWAARRLAGLKQSLSHDTLGNDRGCSRGVVLHILPCLAHSRLPEP